MAKTFHDSSFVDVRLFSVVVLPLQLLGLLLYQTSTAHYQLEGNLPDDTRPAPLHKLTLAV